MSDIRVQDQHGDYPQAPCDRLNVQLVPDHMDGTPQDDRFTDNLGKTAFVGANIIWPQAKGAYTLRVNVANVNTKYGSAEVHTDDIEAKPIIIVVQKFGAGGGQITGNGTCDEWKKAVFAIFAKHGFTNCGPENAGQGVNQAPYLRATINEIKALHPSPFVQWQYSSTGDPKELRTRLFLPNDSGDQFARYADIGDWNKPIVWDHCQ